MTRRPLTRLERTALRAVPPDWRDGIARDLADERDDGGRSLALAAHAVRIGARLRIARAADRFMRRGYPNEGRARSFAMGDLTRDIRLAVRGAARRPWHTLAVVATLAIGIGANTAIYSVFNAVMFRPLPGVARPSELATVRFQIPGDSGRFFVSYRDYADLRDGVEAFTDLAAASPIAVDVAVPGAQDPQRIEAELVTTNYFRTLGVVPSPGRDFVPAEELPGSTQPAAIISRRLWRSHFDSDPRAVGRTLVVNGHTFTVVGIAPAAFKGRSLIAVAELWLPIGAYSQATGGPATGILTDRRRTQYGEVYGRLKPGYSLEVAQQQTIAAAASPEFARRGTRKNGIGPVLYEGMTHDPYARERLLTMFRLVMGAVGLVLLLACANAANLLLARALGRRREIAVCQAIGASRLRITRQLLAEGLVLSAAGGAAGLLLAIGLTSLFDGMRIVNFLPAVKDVAVDHRVILFTTGTALATGVLFALAPALLASRVDLNGALKDGRTGAGAGRSVVRSGLAMVQVAVSVLLLVGAGLLVRSLGNIRSLDIGLDPEDVVSFSANPPRQGYEGARARQYFSETLERLRAIPGVQAAAFGWSTPFLMMRSETTFARPGDTDTRHSYASNTVSPGFFATLGIPLLAGRDFTEDEWRHREGHSGVAIVSERLAREVFPDGRAVGSRLVLVYPKGQEVEIVGVVGDVRGRPLTRDPEGYAYFPASDTQWGTVHVRSSLPLAQLTTAIRDVARALDPNLPPYDIEPFTASLDRTLAEHRLLARVSTVLGLVAALLAAIGIYGMMACAVGERMREFGIRLALGARAAAVLTLVLRGAIGVTSAGIVAGLLASAWATRVLESRLFGVEPTDPATLVAACLSLALLALAATLIPAWRATRADPVASLRTE